MTKRDTYDDGDEVTRDGDTVCVCLCFYATRSGTARMASRISCARQMNPQRATPPSRRERR